MTSGPNTNFAFSTPRNGIITQLKCFLSVFEPIVISDDIEIEIKARIYLSATPNEFFTLVASPGFSTAFFDPTVVPVGTTTTLLFNTTISITAQTRILLVISSAQSHSPSIPIPISIYVSAGLTII